MGGGGGGGRRSRRDFGKIPSIVEIPNLIEVQKRSYETFLQKDVASDRREEVGLQVTDVRYVGSQPWPFPQSLILGFVARAENADPLRLDPDEIEEARWFTRDELRSGAGPRALPPPVSIARHILDRWVAGEFS